MFSTNKVQSTLLRIALKDACRLSIADIFKNIQKN
jgi:hypothetical protein